MTKEEKTMVRKLYAEAHIAIIDVMPTDVPNDVLKAVWSKLIVSLANDLANWAMDTEE